MGNKEKISSIKEKPTKAWIKSIENDDSDSDPFKTLSKMIKRS